MDKEFIENLADILVDSVSFKEVKGNRKIVINTKQLENGLSKIGENARRGLEIGILQDELVKLGFEINPTLINEECMEMVYSYYSKNDSVDVEFNTFIKMVRVYWDNGSESARFNYSSSKFHDKVLTKVKELINE